MLFDSSADGGDDTVKIERLTDSTRMTFDTVYADSELMLIGMGYDQNGGILTNMGGDILPTRAQMAQWVWSFSISMKPEC